jgi:hypothetical protein
MIAQDARIGVVIPEHHRRAPRAKGGRKAVMRGEKKRALTTVLNGCRALADTPLRTEVYCQGQLSKRAYEMLWRLPRARMGFERSIGVERLTFREQGGEHRARRADVGRPGARSAARHEPLADRDGLPAARVEEAQGYAIRRYALAAREKGMLQSLKACPACGKQTGKLIENKSARFPFRVQCGACGWTTDAVKLGAVAVKLWNESKRESKARARPK